MVQWSNAFGRKVQFYARLPKSFTVRNKDTYTVVIEQRKKLFVILYCILGICCGPAMM